MPCARWVLPQRPERRPSHDNGALALAGIGSNYVSVNNYWADTRSIQSYHGRLPRAT